MAPLRLALQFLTTLPLPGEVTWDATLQRRSLALYPLVGLLIGALLLLAAWVLQAAPVSLSALLLLALWVGLSGALHLDGLADSADAWLGGHGDRERSLAIMKDSACGPAGVVVLVLLLLLKFAALQLLLERQLWAALLVVPALGRGLLPFWFSLLPYVRPGGMGEALAGYRPGPLLYLQMLPLLLALFLIGDWAGTLALLLMAATFILWRRSCRRLLGGTTGDTAGALVEMAEAALLLGLALIA